MTLFNFFKLKNNSDKKAGLQGTWEAIQFNDTPLSKYGFVSIKMTISFDRIEVIIEMNTVGEITTKSESLYKIKDDTLLSKFGDATKESHYQLKSNNLIFTPDPLLNEEIFLKSEYRRIS